MVNAYDGKGLAQTVYVYFSLTTGTPPALSTTCLASPNPVTVSQPVNFLAFPTGGRPPYAYSWSQAASGTGTGAPFSSATTGTFNAHITVTDSSSPTHQTAAADCTVSVNNWSPASMLSPAPGGILQGGGAATFSWSSATGASQYQLSLGSTWGAADFGSVNTGSVQNASMQLPSGSPPVTIWATLGSLFGTTWLYRYYSYEVAAITSSPGPNGIVIPPPAIGPSPLFTQPGEEPGSSLPPASNTADHYLFDDGNEHTWYYALLYGNTTGITCQMDDPLLSIDNTQAPAPNQPYAYLFTLTFKASPGVRTGDHTLTCTLQGHTYSLLGALTIYDATPQITDVEPAAVSPGTPPAIISQGGLATITGKNFGQNGTLQLCDLNNNCSATPSTTWGSSQITATINASPGRYTVMVASTGSQGTGFLADPSLTSADSNTWEVDVAGAPVITNVTPALLPIGGPAQTLTVTGSGFCPTTPCNLIRIGFTAGITGGGTTTANNDTTVTISNVAATYTAAIGDQNQVVVSVNGVPSNGKSIVVNGPDHFVVLNDGLITDQTGHTRRITNYTVTNFDGTSSGSILIAENISLSGWNCDQAQPANTYDKCDGTSFTTTEGELSDGWDHFNPGFTPSGCGLNITDLWQWCDPKSQAPTAPITFGKLMGFIHTDASQIDGYTLPGTPFKAGTIIKKDGTVVPPQ